VRHRHTINRVRHTSNSGPGATHRPAPIMPSILSKLGGSSKRNPYSNPHHPSHAPIPTKPTTPPLRTVSPRTSHDYLAEARQVANRDPITGRAVTHPVVPQTSSGTSRLPAQSSRANVELSAYLNRAKQTAQTTGTRYDLFSRQEREKFEREEKVRIARGGTEFYAPERRIEEYFAEGVRD
jgi:hypothetical protein